MDDINFYYVVWGHKRWNILLMSMILLRKVYPDGKITIICYDRPPTYFLEKKYLINYELIYIETNNFLEKKFKKLDIPLENLLRSHRNCLYKAINFFEIASKSNSKVILLDCDVFIVSSFKNFDWNKLCIYCRDDYVNVGVVGYNTCSESFNLAKKYFYENIYYIMSDNFKQCDYIKKALSEDWLDWRLSSLNLGKDQISKNILMVHEEIIFNYIFKHQNKDFFHNIGIENNGMILRPERREDYKKSEINNLHLMGMHAEQAEQIVLGVKYFKKILKDNFKQKEYEKEFENDVKKIDEIIKEKIKL